MMDKRLYRSRTHKLVGGVCGGIAEYFGLDPTLVRILTVLLFLLPGFGILAYIVAWIIIPLRPIELEAQEAEYKFSPWNKYLPGLLLILFGMILLTREYVFFFAWGDLWPFLLILVGAGLIYVGWNRHTAYHGPEIHTNHHNSHNEGPTS